MLSRLLYTFLKEYRIQYLMEYPVEYPIECAIEYFAYVPFKYAV